MPRTKQPTTRRVRDAGQKAEPAATAPLPGPKPVDSELAQWTKHTVDCAMEAFFELKGGERGLVYVFVANFPSDELASSADAVARVGETIRANGELLIAKGLIPAMTTVSFDA